MSPAERLARIMAARGPIGEKIDSLGHFVAIGQQLAKIFDESRMPTGSALTQHRSLARTLGLDVDAAGQEAAGIPKTNAFFNNWLLRESRRGK